MMLFLLFFFFSSRRRHTRFKCNWSSDVCSSDLYGLLTCRLSQLEARLHEINTPDQNGKPKHWADYQLVALKEARDQVEDLNSQLHRYPAGLQWVLGLGYVNAWSKLHRAEEALIEVEPVEMVIRGALHDKLSIQ